MRKIISILVALGLVLGLVVMATPTAAQVCEAEDMATVTVDPDCACTEAAYNITWNISASLTQGVGCVCVEFPAGTTVPATFHDGDILIGTISAPTCEVFAAEITVTGTKVCFIPPCTLEAGEITVLFTDDADIENPCTPGDYVLKVNTCRAPDSTPLEGEYTIVPEVSVVSAALDFSLTYPDLAKGFIPPFRACGQNDTPAINTEERWGAGNGWFNVFNLTVKSSVVGCEGPCNNATVWFELVSLPEGEEIHLELGGLNETLDACNITDTVGEFDDEDWEIATGVDLSAASFALGYVGYLHFSSPGDYEMRFYVECQKSVCLEAAIVASKTAVFHVYQDKEAYKLTLCEKWNLVSLPLVPLGATGSIAISDALGSAAILGSNGLARGVIGAIWYYDAFTGEWLHWTAATTDTDTLTTLEDGKAYWVYVAYPVDKVAAEIKYGEPGHTLGLGCCPISWWVWGTSKPVPPASPSEYAVNLGWNMVGFTSILPSTPAAYLWNWSTAPNPVVYGYTDGCWNVQTWVKQDFAAGTMTAGEGYWISFPKAGSVFVP